MTCIAGKSNCEHISHGVQGLLRDDFGVGPKRVFTKAGSFWRRVSEVAIFSELRDSKPLRTNVPGLRDF